MSPHVEGTVRIGAGGSAFMDAFARRLRDRLFPSGVAGRNRYGVIRATRDQLSFRALDGLTALSVGLNDVELRVGGAGFVHYRVRFWRWAGYVLALSGLIGGVLIAAFLAIDLRAFVIRNPAVRLPGLSVEQNVGVAWASAVFWGFVWPWILIALHRPQVRRLMERLIAEVDAAARS